MNEDIDLYDQTCKAFIIGDPHFKYNDLESGRKFSRECIQKAKENKPDFIVVLGDLLHDHEVIRTQPHKMALTFIHDLSVIAPTFLIVGNHDYINNTQFLTNNHIFTPLQLWKVKNITIVDFPLSKEINNLKFIFCPYVQEGRFLEALNKIEWDDSICIFAHQEIRGCKKRDGIISTEGDVWSEDNPPLISGHMHHEQILNNVYYPGCPLQHIFGDGCTKYVWSVTFNISGIEDIEKINLNLRQKKTLVINSKEDLKTLKIKEETKENDIRLSFTGSLAEYKLFRESNEFQELGVKIAFTNNKQIKARKVGTIITILKDIVKEKPENVKKALVEVLK